MTLNPMPLSAEDLKYIIGGSKLALDHLNRAFGPSLTRPTRDAMQVVKVLRRAAELVEQPEGWCQGAHCRINDRHDESVINRLGRISMALAMAVRTVTRQEAKALFDLAEQVCLEGALYKADLELYPPQRGEHEFADVTQAILVVASYITLHQYRIELDQRDLDYYAQQKNKNPQQWQMIETPEGMTYIVPSPYVFNDWRTTTAEMVAGLLREVADYQERVIGNA